MKFNYFKNLVIGAGILAAVAMGSLVYRHFSRLKNLPPPRAEINITIIPGWNLRQIANDWTKKGIIKNADELYTLVGKPALDYRSTKTRVPKLSFIASSSLDYFFKDKPTYLSYEGYFLPDTYRVYADAKPEEIIKKIFENLDDKITPQMRTDIAKQGKTWEQIMTMASVIEKEAPTPESMAVVSDIFWRRDGGGWPLQSCATVNYVTGKSDPAINAKDRQIDSLFNTYLYPGLPFGPISNPSLNAIKAAIYPTKNDYWYFMSGRDGQMHYGKTLEEHNRNVYKYLR